MINYDSKYLSKSVHPHWVIILTNPFIFSNDFCHMYTCVHLLARVSDSHQVSLFFVVFLYIGPISDDDYFVRFFNGSNLLQLLQKACWLTKKITHSIDIHVLLTRVTKTRHSNFVKNNWYGINCDIFTLIISLNCSGGNLISQNFRGTTVY